MLDFRALAEKNYEYAVKMRRYFHENPELSTQEENTSRKVSEELTAMGIPHTRFDDHTVIGVIETGKPGRRIGIRGDMDALPIVEETGLEFSSKVKGVMHACGHDSHTANLLAIAKSLQEVRDELKGTYYILFQTAEEQFKGGKLLLRHVQEMGGVDRVIAIHVSMGAPTGTVSIADEVLLAGVTSYRITVRGRGGHGSSPHNAIDPIKPASEIVMRLASLPSNSFNAKEPIVFSTCSFHSGTAINIVPEEAVITGTVRYFNKDFLPRITGYLEDISKLIAESYGATRQVEYVNDHIYPVVNTPQVARFAKEIARSMDNVPKVNDLDGDMGSDDIAMLIDEYGGFYGFVGAADPESGHPYVNSHSSTFNIDENYMKVASEFLMRCATALRENDL